MFEVCTRRHSLVEKNLDTKKARAAYAWLMANNPTYKHWIDQHKEWREKNGHLSHPKRNLETATLLLHSEGIETACFPILYARHQFGDTNIKSRLTGGHLYGNMPTKLSHKAVPSIKRSFLRKCLSRCAAYATNPMLVFLLYDIAMARQISAGLSVSERKGLGADIIEGNKHYSESYWRHEQDINADMAVSILYVLSHLATDTTLSTHKSDASNTS